MRSGTPPPSASPSCWAIVPVRALEGAKSRLGEVLDAEERHDLAVALLEGTVRAAVAARSLAGVVVVSPDPAALAIAEAAGARPLRQTTSGLNAALAEARAEALRLGATEIVVLPTDLPRVGPDVLDDLVAEARRTAGPLVLLVPDRHGRGTNALFLRPPGVIEFAFGGDSRLAHAALAGAAGAPYRELEGPLSMDLDTPEDLVLAEPLLLGSRHGR
ncbi:MAG TPA: 2-phospho-L-lactate guanylyltransferase [Candidatus Binatia bacterium]|nr:2-phospho-L-lactate guanylyltransferase [Candidatus Binatia bacterium]